MILVALAFTNCFVLIFFYLSFFALTALFFYSFIHLLACSVEVNIGGVAELKMLTVEHQRMIIVNLAPFSFRVVKGHFVVDAL